MDPIPVQHEFGTTPNTNEGDDTPDRAIKDYLVGPTASNPVVHGWSSKSVLFNHLDENIEKVINKPVSTVAAVIVTRDRPTDRAAGADAIADALDELKLANKDDFVVIPPTPKAGDPSAPILPHTNIIICNSLELKDKVTKDPSKAVVHTTRKDGSDGFTFYLIPAFSEPSWYIGTYVGLSDRITRVEFISALFEKLIADRAVIQMVLDNHDRVPDAHDIPLVIRVLLEHTQIKPCEVWMPGRQGRAPEKQNTIRLYMPSPSLNNDEMKAFKEHLTAPTFSFLVDCRGRATPFQPSRGGRPRPMECTECLGLDHYKDNCPITTAPEFLAVHLNDAEQNSVRVGTTLGSITAHNDVTPPDAFKTVSYRTPRGDRGGSRNYRGGRLRGRGRGRGRDF